MATFALIHGGGASAWDWHLVAPALHERGHDAVAVDLPIEDESAGWGQYTDVVVQALGGRRGVGVVGHSLGGFAAPLACVRIPVDLLILVAAMIPVPGELFADWWANVGYEESGYDDVFYHDVPPQLTAEARRRERKEVSKALQEPWPLAAWPETPTRYLLCRDDRMFLPAWARRHARDRIGVEPDEMDGGHYISLSRPLELDQKARGVCLRDTLSLQISSIRRNSRALPEPSNGLEPSVPATGLMRPSRARLRAADLSRAVLQDAAGGRRGEQLVFSLQTLETVSASRLKREPGGAFGKVAGRGRHQGFAGSRLVQYSGRGVHHQASNVIVSDDHLAAVDGDPDREPDRKPGLGGSPRRNRDRPRRRRLATS